MVETLKNTQLHGGAKVLIAKKRAVNVSKGGTVCAGLACAFEAFFWKLNPFVLNPLPFNWQYIKSMPDQQVKKPTCSILNLNGSIGSIHLPTSVLDFSRVSIMDWELLGCAYSQGIVRPWRQSILMESHWSAWSNIMKWIEMHKSRWCTYPLHISSHFILHI